MRCRINDLYVLSVKLLIIGSDQLQISYHTCCTSGAPEMYCSNTEKNTVSKMVSHPRD